jgi:hypothetical protein
MNFLRSFGMTLGITTFDLLQSHRLPSWMEGLIPQAAKPEARIRFPRAST